MYNKEICYQNEWVGNLSGSKLTLSIRSKVQCAFDRVYYGNGAENYDEPFV